MMAALRQVALWLVCAAFALGLGFLAALENHI